MISGLLAALLLAQGSAVTVTVQGVAAPPSPRSRLAALLALTLEEGVIPLAVTRLMLPAPDKPGDPRELVLLDSTSRRVVLRLGLTVADTRAPARYLYDGPPVRLPSRDLVLAAPVDTAWMRLSVRRKLSRTLELRLVRAESHEPVTVVVNALKRPRGDDPQRLANQALEAWASALPALERGAGPGDFVLPRGSWRLDEDLVIPRGASLTVAAGASLHLAPARSIYAYGQLHLEGTADAPVEVVPAGVGPWATIALLGAGSKGSALRYSRLVRGSQGFAGEIDLNGTVTALDTEVTVEGCRFESLRGEDAIHVTRGRLTVLSTSFERLVSDGVDLVESQGHIEGCRFVDLGDDAIDAGQRSRLTVEDTLILRAGGKAISAGQASRIEVEDVFMLESGRGISSFEGSAVTASRAAIAFSRRSGVQASARRGTEAGEVTLERSLLWQNGSDAGSRGEHVALRQVRTDVPIDLAANSQPTEDEVGIGPRRVPPEPPTLADYEHTGDVPRPLFAAPDPTEEEGLDATKWALLFGAVACALGVLLLIERRLRT